MYAENYLCHYGVLGMHWGQRRARMNEKIAKIQSKGSASGTSDQTRFNQFSQSTGRRLAVDMTKKLLVTAGLTAAAGGLKATLGTDKKKIALSLTKTAIKMAVDSGIKIVEKDILTMHALKRYDEDGNYIRPKNEKARKYITSTDVIEGSVRTALFLARPLSLGVRFLIARDTVTKRKEQEAFDKWGANILPQNVNNIIWQSKDLESSVIDGPIHLNKHKP